MTVYGPQVELIVVADDCALEGKGITGRRGIAGTVFVHKVRKPVFSFRCCC
jgi:dihydroxyacetone kinase